MVDMIKLCIFLCIEGAFTAVIVYVGSVLKV
jgi:hypothetical protein